MKNTELVFGTHTWIIEITSLAILGWIYNLRGLSLFIFEEKNRFKLYILASDIDGRVYVIHF